MHKVSLKVLALLAALTLVWGTNWPMFAIALSELPVLTFRTGELSPAAVAKLERHLAVCDSCVAYIATYRTTIRIAHATARYDDTLVETAPGELVEAILDTLRRS